jgi:hypothetical protein
MGGVRGRRRLRVSGGEVQLLVAVTLIALVVLAGCASAGGRPSVTPAASPTATHAPLPTSTPAPTVVAITDLGQFRQALASAFTSGTWSKVGALLSPAFTYQGAGTGGAQIEMPQSAQQLKQSYGAGGGWSQSQRPIDILQCDAGNTPQSQQMGFAGNDGSYVLLGLARWQGYWVTQWAYRDPIGESGACAYG